MKPNQPQQRQVRYPGDEPTPITTPARAMPLPKPPKKRHWLRWVLIFFGVILVSLAIYAIYLVSIVAKISTKPFDLSPLATDANGRTNVLIMGVGDPGHAGEGLSDTMMIVSLDSKTKRSATISIPRDLRAYIPGHGYGKINSANVYGGPQLAMQTVSNTFGIPIHYYIKTDFSGLVGVVDAVGGIDVNVKERLADPEYPCDDNQYKSCGLVIEPGLQHMDGAQALKYARCRKGTCGNDFGRAARQQEVISLVQAKVMQPSFFLNPRKLVPFVTAVQKGIETNMSGLQLLQFGWRYSQAQKNNPISIVLSTSNGGYLVNGGGSDLVPADGTGAAMRTAVENVFNTVTPGADGAGATP